MKNFINILVLALIITPSIAVAQSYFDIASISYEHSEYSPQDAPNFTFDRFQARINLGTELKNEDYILGSISGEIFKFQDVQFGSEELDLYSSFISAGYLHFWNDKKWSLLTQVRFKLNSDHFSLQLEDLQTGGWFMFTYKRSEKLSLFAGMYFNQEVDKDLLFPIGGIHWIPDDKWNLYVLVPSVIRFEWILKKNSWYTGLESDWNLNSYLIKEDRDLAYFRKETLVTSVFIEKHISEKLVFFGKLGNYQINDYEAFGNSGDQIRKPQLESGLLRNLSLQAGLAYRLRFQSI